MSLKRCGQLSVLVCLFKQMCDVDFVALQSYVWVSGLNLKWLILPIGGV